MSAKKRKRVKRIIDGDTFEVNDARIRIANFNTPEKGQKNYTKAKKDLSSIIPKGTLVNVNIVAQDKYGRKIANVENKKGNIVDQMKKLGHGNKSKKKKRRK